MYRKMKESSSCLRNKVTAPCVPQHFLPRFTVRIMMAKKKERKFIISWRHRIWFSSRFSSSWRHSSERSIRVIRFPVHFSTAVHIHIMELLHSSFLHSFGNTMNCESWFLFHSSSSTFAFRFSRSPLPSTSHANEAIRKWMLSIPSVFESDATNFYEF